MASSSRLIRRISFLVVLSMIALLHVYIGSRLLDAFMLTGFARTSACLAVAALFLAQMVSWLSRFIFTNAEMADTLSWIGMLAMGFFSSLLVLTFLRDLLLIVSSFLFDASNLLQLHIYSELFVIGIAFLASAIGFVSVLRTPDVVRVTIPIKRLDDHLKDFSLVQISDIHIGPTIKAMYLSRIVAQVNLLNPSVVVITGDLVDGSVEKLHADVAPLSEIKSAYGTYFVTGNHEYYSGAIEWINYLRSLDIHVLINENRIINHKGAVVVMAGICDYSAYQFIPQHTSNPQAALAGTEDLVGLKIMLAHQPRSAAEVAKTSAQVQLSGHTHGGQFWPWNFFVRLQQPYNVGLHKLNNLWIYINRGTGYWGPPKRLGKRSEITFIQFNSVD